MEEGWQREEGAMGWREGQQMEEATVGRGVVWLGGAKDGGGDRWQRGGR